MNAQGHWTANINHITQGAVNSIPSTDSHPAMMMAPSYVPGRQASFPLLRPPVQLHLPNQPQSQPQIRIQPGHPVSAPPINTPQIASTSVIRPSGKPLPSSVVYTNAPSSATSSSTLGLSRPASRPKTVESIPASMSDLPAATSQYYHRRSFNTELLPVSQVRSTADLIPDTSYPNNFRSPMSDEYLRTLRITSLSSRGSAGPSEGVSEVMTPLDAVSGTTINVAESPTVEGQVMVQKSGNMMDIDEVEVPLLSQMRKKPRLDSVDGHILPDRQTSTTTAVTPVTASATISTSPKAAAAVPGASNRPAIPDVEKNDDDEIGPDGMRSISSCLDFFTEEDENGNFTCSLCM